MAYCNKCCCHHPDGHSGCGEYDRQMDKQYREHQAFITREREKAQQAREEADNEIRKNQF